MEEDKTQLSIDEGQPSLPDTGIQEQIKLDVAGPETLDTPVPERTTGNVIDISGDLIDKIMAEQSVSHEVSAPPEGGQEWEKPQEQPEPPRRGRRPKNKEAPVQGEKPKRKGRPPKSEKQAPGGGGTGRAVKTPRQGKGASQPAPAKEEAPPPVPAPEEPTQPKDASRGEKEEIVYLDLDQLYPFQNHPFGVRDDMSRDLLRRSRVLVVCGHAVTEAVKNDIAVAQRLKITATTLEGILTVKGQGRC